MGKQLNVVGKIMNKRLTIAIVLLLLVSFSVNARHPARNNKLNYSFAVYFVGNQDNIKQQEILKILSKSLTKFTAVKRFKKKQKGNYFAVTVMNKTNPNYFVPNRQYLRYTGLGLSSKQIDILEKKPRMAYISFFYNSDVGFTNLHKIENVLHEICKKYNAVIWDDVTRQMISIKAWATLRLSHWQDGVPYVPGQVNTHAYKNGKSFRIISMSQKKFGYPDIAIERFMWMDKHYAGLLISLVSQALVEKAVQIKLGKFVIDLNRIKNRRFRKIVMGQMNKPLPQKITIAYRVVKRDKGDPDNMILSLDFRWKSGRNEHDKQHKYFLNLFKQHDRMDVVKDSNREILAASRRAIERLPVIKKRFNKGLAPGFVRVKAPFRGPNGGVEYMWVEVFKWKGKVIDGTLVNSPVNIPSLKVGDKVKLRQSEVFDYILRYANGVTEGNESGKLIHKYRLR